MRRGLLALATLAALTLARPGMAHDVTVGVLALEERAPGRFEVAWTPPADSLSAPADVTFRLDGGCTRDDRLVTCGPEGLRGAITFDGLHDRRMQVLVTVRRLDGTRREELVTAEAASVDLGEHAGGGGVGAGRSVPGWIGVGLQHVLGGLDHLAFVIGMVLVVGWAPRRLAATVTTFTLAHSITLALAVLGVARLPSAPVEATIAASVVLLAREALGDEATLTRARPWWVAGAFGLVHGLGFAGALEEVGVPRETIGAALLGFNLGIEAGQLLVVAAMILVAWAGRRWALAARGRVPVAYVLGCAGAWWLVERTARVLAGT